MRGRRLRDGLPPAITDAYGRSTPTSGEHPSPFAGATDRTKLEPHADVDFVRSLAASPPTIETFISSGGSPGNQHSPATSPPQQFCVALRANELSLIGGYFAHSLATSSSPIIPETRRRRLIAVGIPTRHRGAGRVRCGVS